MTLSLCYHQPRALWETVRPSLNLCVACLADSNVSTDLGATHSIGAPIYVYPLYENGFRALRGQSLAENNEESAELYAQFAKVAEKHPISWFHGKPAETRESIGTVTKKNRMICYPCNTRFMSSKNNLLTKHQTHY